MYGKKIKAKDGIKAMDLLSTPIDLINTYKGAKGDKTIPNVLGAAGSIATKVKGGIDKYKAGRAKKKPMSTPAPLMTGGDTTQTVGAGLGTSSRSPLKIDGAVMNWAKGSVPALKYGGKRKSKGKKKLGCK